MWADDYLRFVPVPQNPILPEHTKTDDKRMQAIAVFVSLDIPVCALIYQSTSKCLRTLLAVFVSGYIITGIWHSLPTVFFEQFRG